MNQPTQIQAEVTPFEYAPGLEAGLRILGMDGKPEFHPRSDSQIYKAYQSRIDYSLVTPFIVYNHMQLPLRPNDRILVKGETVLRCYPWRTWLRLK